MSWYKDITKVEHWGLNAVILLEVDPFIKTEDGYVLTGDMRDHPVTGFTVLDMSSGYIDLSLSWWELTNDVRRFSHKVDESLMRKAAIANLVADVGWGSYMVDMNDQTKVIRADRYDKNKRLYIPIILNNISSHVENDRGNKTVTNAVVFQPFGKRCSLRMKTQLSEGDKPIVSIGHKSDGWTGFYIDQFKLIGVREGACADSNQRNATLMHEYLHSAHRVSEIHQDMYGDDTEAVTEECIVHYVTDNFEKLAHVRDKMTDQPATNFAANVDQSLRLEASIERIGEDKYRVGDREISAKRVKEFFHSMSFNCNVLPVLYCDKLSSSMSSDEIKNKFECLKSFGTVKLFTEEDVKDQTKNIGYRNDIDSWGSSSDEDSDYRTWASLLRDFAISKATLSKEQTKTSSENKYVEHRLLEARSKLHNKLVDMALASYHRSNNKTDDLNVFRSKASQVLLTSISEMDRQMSEALGDAGKSITLTKVREDLIKRNNLFKAVSSKVTEGAVGADSRNTDADALANVANVDTVGYEMKSSVDGTKKKSKKRRNSKNNKQVGPEQVKLFNF